MNNKDELALIHHKLRALNQYMGNNTMPDVVLVAIKYEISHLKDRAQHIERNLRKEALVEAMNLSYAVGDKYRWREGKFEIYDAWYTANVSRRGSLSGVEHEEEWEIGDITTDKVYLISGYSMSIPHELFTQCMERMEDDTTP